ncbi:hypothetical protein EJ04DRAFT_510085 [Polyplosphaeria fusca]|uniref:Uncharacterized protein n=1 Tax=Polyplosphaeria fusca TaxID=682080 RepID=A0A9P4R614_9PLEO|nr:hypothetical protein EJ04DRAFT_510085 [Polyplosphaeria fusca]
MEGWKSVDLASLSTLAAYSLTTERWGLEQFPNSFPNSFSESDFASIGRNTTGPAKSDIVGLAHGTAVLIVIFTTIIMGWLSSMVDRLELKAPRRAPGPQPMEIRETHHPPAPKKTETRARPVVTTPSDEEKSRDIAYCTDLLRQMYRLELDIWAAQDNVGVDANGECRRLRERSDALYREIARIVGGWRLIPAGYFSTEEQLYVNEICTAMASASGEAQPRGAQVQGVNG